MALPSTRFPLPRTLLELFAGAAGLGLGLHTAIPRIRTVGYVEREAYAASVLVARMAEALLDQAPVWDDVATFDGRPWRGVVDLLAGGFPCQDISVAGKGAGLAGKRSGLWSEFVRIISEIQPRYVFVENVAALKARGLDSILSDLAALGFDAEWTCYRAADAGAPHRRDRIFILANATGGRGEPDYRGAFPLARDNPRENVGGGGNLSGLAYPLSDLLRDEPGRGSWANGPSPAFAGNPRQDLAVSRFGRRSSDRLPIITPPEVTRPGIDRGPSLWPPGPNDHAGWAAALANRPDLEPAVCRVADGLADRVDRLRVCGNGVVPAQAAQAFSILWDRMISPSGPIALATGARVTAAGQRER